MMTKNEMFQEVKKNFEEYQDVEKRIRKLIS